ncbi:MAG: YbaB/EbfC family nucleoid-associated protein [Magnetococcales bacterium]|nr:YbaB/EbfC family nucleoid-associated protein [Magnetococcales bacterium]MBF0419439.1 YbaB/EbfC family nucleoid-associated protein [Magnetococcales bacterium]MBF0435755.1 YbaB/EbfC family nucleoid-associated protein [Magnetococcales bacterium]
MKNLGNILKQAQKMQGEMAKIQEKLAETTVVGQAGGGMVEITMDGKQEVRRVRIDPEVVNKDDVELLEDIIAAAFNDAQKKVQAMTQEGLSKLAGGLNLPPGFNMPF